MSSTMLFALGFVFVGWGIAIPLLLHPEPAAQHIHLISLLRYPGIVCLILGVIQKNRTRISE